MRSESKELSLRRLIDRFAEIAVAQDKALLADDIKTFNRLFWQMEAIESDLKAGNGDQRRLLLRLFGHSNMQVKLMAAKATLTVEPAVARKMLHEIAESGWQPQAGDAGMCLWSLEQGIFKPK